MKFSETQLQGFAAPLSESEDQMCQNAIGMVRDALKLLGLSDDNRPITKMLTETHAYMLEMKNPFTNRRVKIFIQGSYANNTCVRKESDVDIAIVQEEVFQTEYRPGITDAHYNFYTVSATDKSFKDEVQECLTIKFRNDVERKNKSIKVHGNTYRKDADTVPCMRLRNYKDDYELNESNFVGGIVITADSGERIINYPEQHIENGRKKNTETKHVYKRMVRIIKKMRCLMEDYSYTSAGRVSSFGLESLLWNIPNEIYAKYTSLRYIFDEVAKYAYDKRHLLSSYREANGIKLLCPNQTDVANYQAFLTDLVGFYEYDI